jgi:hypothetical protein
MFRSAASSVTIRGHARILTIFPSATVVYKEMLRAADLKTQRLPGSCGLEDQTSRYLNLSYLAVKTGNLTEERWITEAVVRV